MADMVALSNLMGYLFAKHAMLQSMRLGMASAWDYFYPELVEALQLLKDGCPSLVRSFLPIEERDYDIEDEERGI